jgi:hypothetical protein
MTDFLRYLMPGDLLAIAGVIVITAAIVAVIWWVTKGRDE